MCSFSVHWMFMLQRKGKTDILTLFFKKENIYEKCRPTDFMIAIYAGSDASQTVFWSACEHRPGLFCGTREWLWVSQLLRDEISSANKGVDAGVVSRDWVRRLWPTVRGCCRKGVFVGVFSGGLLHGWLQRLYEGAVVGALRWRQALLREKSYANMR